MSIKIIEFNPHHEANKEFLTLETSSSVWTNNFQLLVRIKDEDIYGILNIPKLQLSPYDRLKVVSGTGTDKSEKYDRGIEYITFLGRKESFESDPTIASICVLDIHDCSMQTL